jgi:hypothetical protein
VIPSSPQELSALRTVTDIMNMNKKAEKRRDIFMVALPYPRRRNASRII